MSTVDSTPRVDSTLPTNSALPADPPSNPSPPPSDRGPDTRRLLVRNTAYLTIAQALTVPLSMLVNIVAARHLGAEAFGIAYLTGTMCGFGFLAVTWGHEGVLPAKIAQDHSISGRMLGSSLAWRAVASVIVYAVLALGSHLFGYGEDVQWALGLTALYSMLTAFGGACKDAIRGFERTDIPAYTHVGQQFLVLLLVVPILMLGGKLNAMLTGYVVACGAIAVVLFALLKPAGVGRLSLSWADAKELFKGGTPFVLFGLVMVLQPIIDALFLSKLAPEETMGWYAVSRRLIGVVLFPATALIGALYPTLCRLYAQKPESFAETTSGALQGIALLVVPVTLACAVYPEPAIALFDEHSFGPAADNLRVLAIYVFLVYFSMPLGCSILAAGKQRAWSLVQVICLVVSVVLDPLLVPWFQKEMGNGGLGLCVATVVSEVFVVGCGLAMAPRGILDKKLGKTLLLALVAGAAMAGFAFLTRSWNAFLSAPLALVVYLVVLRATGGINQSQTDELRGFITRKLGRSGAA